MDSRVINVVIYTSVSLVACLISVIVLVIVLV